MMILRYWLWAAVLTLGLTGLQGAVPWSLSAGQSDFLGALQASLRWPLPQLQAAILALSGLGLVAGLLTSRAGEVRAAQWRAAWLSLIAGLWLALTGDAVERELSTLVGFGPTVLRLLRPYAITTTILLGYLVLLSRRRAQPESLPLTLMFPSVVAILVLANPAGLALTWLPMLAASGLIPRVTTEEQTLEPWREGPAALVEMLSLQAVAWGLVLSIMAFLAELVRGNLVMALFSGSATGCFAWLCSGLLWGISENFRRGRLNAAPLARLLFGAR